MDARLREVEWKDLRELSGPEVVHELLISAPWLAGSLAAARGPFFRLRLPRRALAVPAPRQRRWIHAELAANAVWIVVALAVLDVSWLRYHVAAMTAGQCLTAFFAVWTVHHGCEKGRAPIARTIRGRVKALIGYEMFFHVEHHLYPAVPTCRLPVLARRRDAAAP